MSEARPSLGSRLAAATVDFEGSTRAAALIRIGLVLALWGCVGEPLSLTRATGALEAAEIVVFFGASLAMLVGLGTRGATAITAAILVHLYLDAHLGLGGRARAFFGHHHQALLTTVTLLMILVPAGRSISVDRWLALRRAEAVGRPPPPERGPLWGVRLIALQLSAVYVWSAIDKLSPDYLSGARLERIAMDFYLGSDLPESAALHALFVAAAWILLALELALGVGLWWPRARRWLVPAGVALHALFYLALPVCVFSALTVLLYLAFVEPAAVDRALARLLGPGERERGRASVRGDE